MTKEHDNPYAPQDKKFSGKSFVKELHYRFAYGVESPERDSILFYAEEGIAAGTTSIILDYKTDKRPGAFTSFTFGFKNFTPLAGTYDFNFSFGNRPIPWTGSSEKLDISNFLNTELGYFIHIPSTQQKLTLEIVNNGVALITPFLKISGYYLGITNG